VSDLAIDETADCRPARQRAINALYIVVAAMLIVSALLKTYEAALNEPGVAVQRKLMELALIEFELLLGGMLLLNVRPAWGWGIAIATFTIFAGVSVRTSLAGASSCGCWGGAHVDPRLMAAVDVVIVALLVAAGPRESSVAGDGRRRTHWSVPRRSPHAHGGVRGRSCRTSRTAASWRWTMVSTTSAASPPPKRATVSTCFAWRTPRPRRCG
jgi:hypothetical protein